MTRLKQGMSLLDVVALGISAAVGVSIFSVIGPATALAGAGMLISLAVAVVPMVIFAVVYSFLGSADPRTGASYHWPARFIHPFVGFIVCWLRILGSASALNLMAAIFADYLDRAFPVPPRLAMLVVLTVFFLINHVGVDAVGRSARVLTAVKLAVLGIFIGIGFTYLEPAHFVPIAPRGTAGIIAAIPLLVGLFSGIESATEAGEEIRNSRTVIAQGLGVATLVSLIVYFGTSVVVIGVLGWAPAGASRAPLADAVARFPGTWASPALIFTALVAIAAAINAQFLMFARFLFAMGRDGALTCTLARVHPRWGTPWIANIAVYILTLVSLVLPRGLVFLFLAVNIPTVLKYGCNCLSAVRLVERHPQVHRQATIRLGRRTVKWWSYAGLISAAVIVLCGLGADWRPYALLIVWGAAGTVYWLTIGRHRSAAMHATACDSPRSEP